MRMEEASTISRENEQLELPPGFRYHPTDEELITHYLSPKVADNSFTCIAIGEVDLNKFEPWDLPRRAKMGEKEWYFFCMKDRKYPTGLRTNRATEAGYWKATGKDKEIFKAKALVGMKKTLVFYKGRAPRGEKTNWVIHEYRVEGKNPTLTKATKSEWVICRIFKKSPGGKKIHISVLNKASKCRDASEASNLPPLMDFSRDEGAKRVTAAEASHVTCFSNSTEDQKLNSSFSNVAAASSKAYDFSPVSSAFPKVSTPNLLFPAQKVPYMENLQYTDWIEPHEQSILRVLLDGQSTSQNASTDMSASVIHHGTDLNSVTDQEFPFNPTGSVDFDILWNY